MEIVHWLTNFVLWVADLPWFLQPLAVFWPFLVISGVWHVLRVFTSPEPLPQRDPRGIKPRVNHR